MNQQCAVDGCTSPARARGWCGKHYQRWVKSGDPLKAAWERGDPAHNFMAKVDKTDTCWLWTGYRDAAGYGHFGSKISGVQRDQPAHRFSYELHIGPIEDGAQLDHVCHTLDTSCMGGISCPHRACVNPAHLEPVSGAENMRRGRASGAVIAARQRAKTHCPAGHAYDEANTYYDPRGGRVCRACSNSQHLKRYYADPAAYRGKKK